MATITQQEKIIMTAKVLGGVFFTSFGAAGVFWSIKNDNYNSAVWSLMLAVACVPVIWFSRVYVKGELHLKFSAGFFRALKFIALVLSIGCVIAFAAFLALGIINKQDFYIQNYYGVSLMAFLCAFWLFVLAFDSNKFESKLAS